MRMDRTHFIRVLVVAVGMMGWPCASMGAEEITTTQEMLSSCRPVAVAKITGEGVYLPRTFAAGQCWGAFDVIQRMTRHTTYGRDGMPVLMYSICAPSEGTRTQLVSVFVSYAEKHPERLHEDFVRVATQALQEAFPCQVDDTVRPGKR